MITFRPPVAICSTLVLGVLLSSLSSFAVSATRLRPTDTHAKALLENSLKYLLPESETVNTPSGYPSEGWNPNLRGFTQLTSIGEWLEVQSMIAAGQIKADNLTPDQALDAITLTINTLLIDQQNPEISDRGLLSNFIPFRGDKRIGPQRDNLRKDRLISAFGKQKGNALWQALLDAGWLNLTDSPDAAQIQREKVNINKEKMTGPLAAYTDNTTLEQLLNIFTESMANIIYGDNANLSASVAKTIGALLDPAIANNPRATALREKLERFLINQQAGYNHLYDSQAGLFYFGYTGDNIYVGWGSPWERARMAYFMNEFRGPQQFILLRYNISTDATANQFFKMRSYTIENNEDKFTACAWDGSAFQLMGLSLFMDEMNQPAWRQLLLNVVAAEVDYSTRNKLPGFLSESYTGEKYTGDVGIPDLCASGGHRIEYAPSLYTLGVAYQINPEAIEKFLADHWEGITPLFTDHGPWEGFNTRDREIIQQQTSAHTLSLIIGLVGTAPENMQRYLQFKKLDNKFPTGNNPVNLLAKVSGSAKTPLTVKFNTPQNFAGLQLQLGYNTSIGSNTKLTIRLIRAKKDTIPLELFPRIAPSGEISLPLPNSPTLEQISQIEIITDTGSLALNKLSLEAMP